MNDRTGDLVVAVILGLVFATLAVSISSNFGAPVNRILAAAVGFVGYFVTKWTLEEDHHRRGDPDHE